VRIPDGVEVIEAWAFRCCKELCEVHIPKSVKFIDWMSFSECPKLTFYYDGKEQEWAQICRETGVKILFL
jgi:hypothetical protein